MPNIDGLYDGALTTSATLDEDDLYKFVKFSGDREIELADTAGERCYGVLTYAPEEDGESVGVQVYGVGQVRCGSAVTIAAGDLLEVEEGGTVASYTAASNNIAVAVAREAGDDNEIISALIIPGGDMSSE